MRSNDNIDHVKCANVVLSVYTITLPKDIKNAERKPIYANQYILNRE